MQAVLRWFIVITSLWAWAGLAQAQAFEDAPTMTLGIGMLAPSGDMSKYYRPGAAGRLGLRAPISAGTSLGIEAGIYAPNSKSGSATLYQFPIRALLYFPVAPEGSSTPFVALGPGVTFNSVGDDRRPGEPREPPPYFTYALKAGWTFRPEQMSNTIFELGARYEQQFIGGSPSFQTFDLEACIGHTF